jgi:hypothetical protein
VNNQFLSVSRRGFTNENLQQIDAGEATGRRRGKLLPSTLNSALVRATYAINDRYLVTASARATAPRASARTTAAASSAPGRSAG